MAALGTLAEDIKNGSFKKIYYVYGPEAYLKRFYINELKKAVSGGDSSCPDVFVYDGKDLDLRNFTDITEMFPMMSEKKLIIIKDSPISSPVVQYIKESAAEIPDDNIVVLYGETESFDERLKDFKALKSSIEKNGKICKIDKPDTATLERWIMQHTKKGGSEIDLSVARYLLTQAPNDLDTLSTEVHKLSSYCFGRKITKEDIDVLVCKTAEARTFDLTDAILDKNKTLAFEKLEDLYDARTNEIIILSAIFSTFGNMYKIKALISSGTPLDTVAKLLEMKDFMVKKYAQRLRSVSIKELEYALEVCAEADVASKSTSADNKALLASLTAKLLGVQTKK
ncbi:MAG: DNA polymerase III subunit delta [Clostridia bacterium]|nr:DNA polymerase III subunit delta [Clostridia bacterium]